MGYSCNAYASICLDALNELTQSQSHPLWVSRGGNPSNGYLNQSNVPCFYDRGRENKDGAITGQCFKYHRTDELGNVFYMPCGYMRISSEGIERLPGLSAETRKKINARARVRYQETYKHPYVSPKERASANRFAYLTDRNSPLRGF